MTYDQAAIALQADFPQMTLRELRDFTRDFVELHLENMQEYHDYEEAFADLIERGLLPEDKHAISYDEDTEKYLAIWDLDYIVEYIEDVKEIERAFSSLQERLKPQSGLSRLWAYLKTALRGCRA